MGNSFSFSSYPCQKCNSFFKREFSGSLLCDYCHLINDFEHLNSFQKEVSILSNCMYPKYEFVCFKKPILIIQNELKEGFLDVVWPQVKKYFNENHLDKQRNKFIKKVLYQLDLMSLFNKYKGVYFHTMKSNDILFIHHPNIHMEDRLIHINLDTLEKKIKDLSKL
jgi:hypothetical protein